MKKVLAYLIIVSSFQHSVYAADRQQLHVYYGQKYPYELLTININKTTTLNDVAQIIITEKGFYGNFTIGAPPFNPYTGIHSISDAAYKYINISLFYTPYAKAVAGTISIHQKSIDPICFPFIIPDNITLRAFQQFVQTATGKNVFLYLTKPDLETRKVKMRFVGNIDEPMIGFEHKEFARVFFDVDSSSLLNPSSLVNLEFDC